MLHWLLHKGNGCAGVHVVGLEIDPNAAKEAEQWAERVVVGDIDDEDIWGYVKDEVF